MWAEYEQIAQKMAKMAWSLRFVTNTAMNKYTVNFRGMTCASIIAYRLQQRWQKAFPRCKMHHLML